MPSPSQDSQRPALDVETETPSVVTPDAGSRQAGEEFANRAKRAGVGRGIRARGAPDRRLVNDDRLVDLLQDRGASRVSGTILRTVKWRNRRAPKDVVHEGGLATAGDPVTQVRQPSGNAAVTSRRLFSEAPRTVSQPGNLRNGRAPCGAVAMPVHGNARLPREILPGHEFSTAMMSARVPCATICPPRTPAPGPRSRI